MSTAKIVFVGGGSFHWGPESGYTERYGFLDQMVTVKDRYAARKRGYERWLQMRDGKGLPKLELGSEPVPSIIAALEGGIP